MDTTISTPNQATIDLPTPAGWAPVIAPAPAPVTTREIDRAVIEMADRCTRAVVSGPDEVSFYFSLPNAAGRCSRIVYRGRGMTLKRGKFRRSMFIAAGALSSLGLDEAAEALLETVQRGGALPGGARRVARLFAEAFPTRASTVGA